MPPRSISNCSQGLSVYTINDDCETASFCANDTVRNKPATNPLSKSVRISDQEDVFSIPHLNDMSDEEVAAIWYHGEEYTEIKSSYQATIHLMEMGQVREDDDNTCRGLEYRTQEGAWARYENKRDAYNAVLDEQDRQWKVDKDDEEKISRIYLEHSTKCTQAAISRGAMDAKEAKEICQDILKRRKVRKKKGKSSKSIDVAPPHSPPGVDDVATILRQQSFSRRGQIREDIQKQQAKAMKKDKRQVVVAS